MSAVDLQRRLTRAMARGKGSMMITQADLGVLLESGAYEAVCDAATDELKKRRSESPAAPTMSKSHEDVETALMRARNALKKPSRKLV